MFMVVEINFYLITDFKFVNTKKMSNISVV